MIPTVFDLPAFVRVAHFHPYVLFKPYMKSQRVIETPTESSVDYGQMTTLHSWGTQLILRENCTVVRHSYLFVYTLTSLDGRSERFAVYTIS